MKKKVIFVALSLFLFCYFKYNYDYNFNHNYVAVDDSVSKIVLNKKSLQLQVGKTEKLGVTVTPSTASSEVIWVSNNKSVATISKDGTVSAVGVGKVSILVVSRNNYSVRDICTVVVTANSANNNTNNNNSTPSRPTVVNVSKITLNSTSLNVKKGATGYLKYTVIPSNATNKAVTWNSSNTSIATVDNNGLVKALNVGTAVVTATSKSNPNVKDTCTIVVKEDVQKISLGSNKTISLGIGESKKISIGYTNVSNKTVKWNSSNSGVVSVSNGTIKALKRGNAVITASLASNASVKDSVTVTVVEDGQIYFLATQRKENGSLSSNQSIVIRNSNNQLAVYDTGVNGNCDFIIKQLKEISGSNKPNVQHLFISHTDGDHTGCYKQIINKTNVSNFYIKNVKSHMASKYSDIIKFVKDKKSIKIHYPKKEGQTIKFGNLTFTLFNTKDVFSGVSKCKDGGKPRKIKVLKFWKNTKVAKRYKINNKYVCMVGVNPKKFSYGDECVGNDVYYASKKFMGDGKNANRKYACTDNTNSLALLVSIPYKNGVKYAYLPGDLDNNGYSIFGKTKTKQGTVKHYGAEISYAVKEKNGKIVEDEANNVEVAAEYDTAVNVRNVIGNNNLKNITIYQQSHHGYDNALDACKF